MNLPPKPTASPGETTVLDLIRDRGILRARDLRTRGLSVAYLQRLLAKGLVVRLARGQYVLPDREPAAHDMLALTANRYPGTIVCLLSALRFHELTTQSPGAIWLAVEGSKLAPGDPPTAVQVIRLSGRAFHEGVRIHELGCVPVRIYEPAKTVADCFRFRHRVGLDVALEALRECLRQRQATPAQIWHYAQVCRARTIIRPYLEALA